MKSASEHRGRDHGFRAGAEAVKVMIVDDSLTVRTVLKRMVESDPMLVVAGTASSAERAIAQLEQSAADVILLDLEMPGMGGLDALPTILETASHAQILVVSSLTKDGAETTMTALSMGAADTMLKPLPGGFDDEYRALLLDKIHALGDPEGAAATNTGDNRPPAFAATGALRNKRPEVVAIGASTGGIHALNLLLRSLPPSFDLPILITQHLPASFIPVFAKQLANLSGRKTIVAQDGAPVQRGEIVVASGEGHIDVRRIAGRLTVTISTDPMPSGCTPSVDPMLASLAKSCEGRVLGVILSGMGRDGLEGAKILSKLGGTLYAQDAETSAVWGMPGAVAKAGLTSIVASPERLAEAIASLARVASRV